MIKHHAVRSLSEIRSESKSEAVKLIALFGGLNKAAKAIGMNKGRLSFISRGMWTQVAVNEIDLVMLATGRAIRQNDAELTGETRELAQRFQAQLSDLNITSRELIKRLKRL